MIFKTFYLENKDLKKEVEFYARENWRKEDRIRDLKKQIKELEKEIEELKKRKRKKNESISA